jgi:hypothetical protein
VNRGTFSYIAASYNFHSIPHIEKARIYVFPSIEFLRQLVDII